MNFDETEEQQMLRSAVSSIASRYGHQYYVDMSRSGKKTDELWDELATGGYLGVNVPAEFGGGGQGITELAIVEEELAAQGCPLLLLVVSPAICATIIQAFGTEEQRARWLPGFGDGSLKMAFAITEPDAGSNSHNISTSAARDGDIYRLNGTKYYISGCDESQAVLVVTRTSTDEQSGRGRLSLFVVDLDTPGIEMTPDTSRDRRPREAVHLVLRQCPGSRRPARRYRGGRSQAGLPRTEPGADNDRLDRDRRRQVRAGEGFAVRKGPFGLGNSDRTAPGAFPSLGEGQDRPGARSPHVPESGLGL